MTFGKLCQLPEIVSDPKAQGEITPRNDPTQAKIRRIEGHPPYPSELIEVCDATCWE